MQLERLIYCSQAAPDLSDGDLQAILVTARRRNAELGVTGYLLYDDGCFIQALEGESETVRRLADEIAMDPRHTDFDILAIDPIDEREFGDWAMGCFHVGLMRDHDVGDLRAAMREFIDESRASIRETIGFFRLFLRFDREHATAALHP